MEERFLEGFGKHREHAGAFGARGDRHLQEHLTHELVGRRTVRSGRTRRAQKPAVVLRQALALAAQKDFEHTAADGARQWAPTLTMAANACAGTPVEVEDHS